MRASDRGLRIALLLPLAACYLSHEPHESAPDAAVDAAMSAPDAGRPVLACGGLVHRVTGPGCTTFSLPPTGDATCVGPGELSVTGPTFVVSVPTGMSMSVIVTSHADTFASASGAATEPCEICSTSAGFGPGGGATESFVPDAPTRFVLRSIDDPAGFQVTVCVPMVTAP